LFEISRVTVVGWEQQKNEKEAQKLKLKLVLNWINIINLFLISNNVSLCDILDITTLWQYENNILKYLNIQQHNEELIWRQLEVEVAKIILAFSICYKFSVFFSFLASEEKYRIKQMNRMICKMLQHFFFVRFPLHSSAHEATICNNHQPTTSTIQQNVHGKVISFFLLSFSFFFLWTFFLFFLFFVFFSCIVCAYWRTKRATKGK
jgi:hypothetical protein